jgi:LPPG:FO 2-phospho-L-lactate transferase
MRDERVETHVVVDVPGANGEPAERKAVHFQEWWVRYHAELTAHSIVPVGAEESKPAPGVLESIAEADAVLLGPSNPVVSIGTILAVPGVKSALRETKAGVVGLSPIVGDRPVRGMADACLTAIGVPTTAEAVGKLLGARSDADGILDGWLVHSGDVAEVPGVEVRSIPLLMTSTDATAEMARQALELAGVRA